jgi:hypothetical protein
MRALPRPDRSDPPAARARHGLVQHLRAGGPARPAAARLGAPRAARGRLHRVSPPAGARGEAARVAPGSERRSPLPC